MANGEDAAALQEALRIAGLGAIGRPAGTESSVLEEALRAAAARREAVDQRKPQSTDSEEALASYREAVEQWQPLVGTDDQGFAERFRPLEGFGVDATAEEMRQAIGLHLGWVEDMSFERFNKATDSALSTLMQGSFALLDRSGFSAYSKPWYKVSADGTIRHSTGDKPTVRFRGDGKLIHKIPPPGESKVAETARRKLGALEKLSRTKVARMTPPWLKAGLALLTLVTPTLVNLWDDSPGDDTGEATAALALHLASQRFEGRSEEKGNLLSPTGRPRPSPSPVKFGVRSPDDDDWIMELVAPFSPVTLLPKELRPSGMGKEIASVSKEKLAELSKFAEEIPFSLPDQPLIMFNGTAANDVTNPDSIYYVPFANMRFMPSPDGKKIIKRDNGNFDRQYRDVIYKTLQAEGLTGREFGEMSDAEQKIVKEAIGITGAKFGSGTDPAELANRYQLSYDKFKQYTTFDPVSAEYPLGTQLNTLKQQQAHTAGLTGDLRGRVSTAISELVKGKINSIASQLIAQPGGPTDLTGRRIRDDDVLSEAESRLTQDPAVLRDLLLSATDALTADVIPPGVALTDLMVAEELNKVMRMRGVEDFDITRLTFSPPPGEEPELLRGDPGGAADMPQYIPDFGPETDLSAIPEERLESAVQSFVQQLAGQIANGDLQASQAAQISDFSIGIINQLRDPNNNKIYEIPGAASIENVLNYLPTLLDPKSENHDPNADALKVISMLGQFQNMYASQVEDHKRTQIQRDQLALSQERELQRQREAKATALAQLELQQNQFGRDFIGQLMRDKSSLPPIGVGRKIGGAEQYEALAKRYGVAVPQFDPIGVERIPAPDMQSVFAGAKQRIQEAYPTSEPAAPVG